MAKDDFDFFNGTWDVHNRRLTADGWIEFPATVSCRPLADGIGFIDEMQFPTIGISGHTIGLYDQARDLWAHYWVSSRDGILQAPLYGGLDGFYGDDVLDGKPVKMRQFWRLESEDIMHWEQSHSFDDGQTWQTDWIMVNTRTS